MYRRWLLTPDSPVTLSEHTILRSIVVAPGSGSWVVRIHDQIRNRLCEGLYVRGIGVQTFTFDWPVRRTGMLIRLFHRGRVRASDVPPRVEVFVDF